MGPLDDRNGVERPTQTTMVVPTVQPDALLAAQYERSWWVFIALTLASAALTTYVIYRLGWFDEVFGEVHQKALEGRPEQGTGFSARNS